MNDYVTAVTGELQDIPEQQICLVGHLEWSRACKKKKRKKNN